MQRTDDKICSWGVCCIRKIRRLFFDRKLRCHTRAPVHEPTSGTLVPEGPLFSAATEECHNCAGEGTNQDLAKEPRGSFAVFSKFSCMSVRRREASTIQSQRDEQLLHYA
jgi:hypothetical protein